MRNISNYKNEYHYSNTNNPHAVRKIENTMTGKVDHYEWNAKGNMIEHFAEDTEQLRRLCWTEDNTEPAFYYHGDHLGSASYVTASNGAVVQTLNYLPYGEDWVDLQNFNAMPQGYNMGVYKYNGKEKDAETGYHYYGARYYDSEKIGWLSVDPLADKYPSLSNYVYCSNNPIRLVDPNGMDEFKFDESGNFKGKTEAKHDIVRIVDGDGNIIAETRQFPLGTIKHEKTKYKYYDQLSNPEYNIDAFEVKGSDVGEELFIFFAENITAKNGIEYSRFIFEDGLNTVSTSHLIDRDASHAYIYEKYCKQPTSRKAIQHDHSHGNTFKLSDGDLEWRSFLEMYANPEIITRVFCKGEFKTYGQNGYEN